MIIKCNLEESVIVDLKEIAQKIFGEAQVTQGFVLGTLIAETPHEELAAELRKIPPRGGTNDTLKNISWALKQDYVDTLDSIANELESSRTAAVRAVIRLAAKRYHLHDDNAASEKSALAENNAPEEHFISELKDFINAERPWEINLLESLTPNRNFKAIKTTFERYISYKAASMENKKYVYPHVQEFVNARQKDCQGVYDPDGGSFDDHYSMIWEIYNILWGWASQENFSGSAYGKIACFEGCRFGADSMNSIQNTLRLVIDNLPVEKKTKPKGYTNSKAYFIECYLGENKDEFRKEIETPLIDKYINSCHTIGNFVLVPAGFNGFRGTDSKICDFWDRSLVYLQQGYKDKRYEDIYGEFKPELFNRYINCFFLWDHVKKSENGGYIVKKNDLDDMSEFFKLTAEKTTRRGKFMTAMLMIARRGKYQALQETFFNSDNCYDGFCDVIEQIKASDADLTDEELAILNDIAEEEGEIE